MNEKYDIFVERVNAGDSYRQAAIAAGYAPASAHKRGSELMKKPEISKRIKVHQDTQKALAKEGQEDIKTIFESNVHSTLKALIDKPDKFWDAYLKFQKMKKEELGEFDGYSIGEIVNKTRETITDAQEIIRRIEETQRDQTLQE